MLTLDDAVANFFPEKLPDEVPERLLALKVEHLLTMSVGHSGDSTDAVMKERDWVRTFLSLPFEFQPGTTFAYNSAATYVLSAILQRLTGQTVLDYLEPRLFAPLQIREKQWDVCPQGINTGGWGLSLTIEALAKFGQLHLQEGEWHGVQVIPRGWVREATSCKIQQPISWRPPVADPEVYAAADALERLKSTSDLYQGYGYQFWRCRHGAYRALGAFGQQCIVLPQRDAVIAMIGNEASGKDSLELVFDYLLPAMHNDSLPEDTDSSQRLQHELTTATLALPCGALQSKSSWQGIRRFRLAPNGLNAAEVAFDFEQNSCVFTLVTNHGSSALCVGLGQWMDDTTDMPGTPPRFLTTGDPRPVRVAAAGAWRDDVTFDMQWRFVASPFHDRVICRFDGQDVRIEFLNSIAAAYGNLVQETRSPLYGHATS